MTSTSKRYVKGKTITEDAIVFLAYYSGTHCQYSHFCQRMKAFNFYSRLNELFIAK